MFTILWTVGFMVSGAPHIEYLPDTAAPRELAYCEGYIEEREERMADLVRGQIGVPLDFPVWVKGECKPVLDKG